MEARMKAFVVFTIVLVSSVAAVTEKEIQDMKKELKQELSKMEGETDNNKKNKDEKKSVSQDPRYKDMLEDLLELDVQKSLKGLKTANADRAAIDFLKMLIKEDQKSEQKSEVETAFQSLLLDESLKKKELIKKDADHKAAVDITNHAEQMPGDFNSCKDDRSDCWRLKALCGKKVYEKYFKQRCAKTCEFCQECKDEIPRKSCLVRKRLCQVERNQMKDRMKKLCYETCGYCRQRSPPACAREEFGCCWDNSTKKTDPTGANCPKCEDKYTGLCKNFQGLCAKKKRFEAVMFVRKYCPQTCGLCRKDSVTFACVNNMGDAFCKKAKLNQYCQVLDVATRYCTKSCSDKCN